MTRFDLSRTHLVWQDDSEFEAYAEHERSRRRRSSGSRPIGARLSTPCPVRMVQAVYDDRARIPIDPGDADRGHEIESRVRATLFADVEHVHQPAFEWAAGFSAFDIRATETGELFEVKSTIGRLNLHPDYRYTTQRRMVAAGMAPGQHVDVLVVSPSNYTWAGPFRVDLDPDRYDRFARELERVVQALEYLEPIAHPDRDDEWRSAAWWQAKHYLECSCGGCTDHTELTANGALERIAFRIEHAMNTASEAGQLIGGKVSWNWLDTGARADLIEALDRQAEPHKAAARETGSSVVILTWGAGAGLRCSWSPKTQRWTIKRRKDRNETAGAAA